ncbi:MAG TPA: DNA polymerase Y family protein [Candidatus Binataceae bacterium]|nr:DNA polymerase Y family protein [Candidatus Binataceae bacterium]
MARIACIFVADFPIAAIVRANPALADAVLALAESSSAHAEILCVSPQARALGIHAGMTLAQARNIASSIAVHAPARGAESSAHQALADAAESISPVVEPGAPGCVWLDLAGLGRIFTSEDALAAEITRRVRRLGMEAAVGVGASREVAAMAARCGGIRVIAAGREREFLDWIPIDMLGLGAELEGTLIRWGMRRLGDLARLDPDAIGSRLGRRGVELMHLARGGSSRPLTARRRAEIFTESAELEYAIDNLEPLGFVIRGILERIVERLRMRGLAAGDAMLALGLEDHRVASRRVTIAAPTCDVRALLTLIKLALEAAPPEAAVETIRLEIAPRAPRPAQTDMFLPPAPAPDRLAATIARLAALCGPGNVGAIRAENSHRPEVLRIEAFDPPPALPASNAAPDKSAAQLVMRALRPALEIEVMVSRGGPEFVRGANLGARVVSIAGPWRRDGEWWTGGAQATPTVDPQGTADNCRIAVHSSPSPESRTARTELPSPSGRGRRAQRVGEGAALRGQGLGRYDPAGATNHPKNFERTPLRSALNNGPSSDRVPVAPPVRGEGSEKGKGSEERERRCGFLRDYYELALDDGGVYRVFFDLNSERWFLDGVYD